MVKATVSLGHKIIHTILKYEKYGSEKYMIDTMLVLTQTVSSVEKQLVRVYDLQPVMDTRCDFYGVSQGAASCTVTNVKVLAVNIKDSYVPIINHRFKTIWKCLYSNIKNIYVRIQGKYDKNSYQKCVVVISLVQRHLQELGCDISFPKLKVKQGNSLSINGLYYSAIEVWKNDVNIYIAQGICKKKLSRRLHSMLYAYIFLKDYSGLALFIKWMSSLITHDSVQNYISSSHASHSSSKKSLRNERTLYSEPRQSSSLGVENGAGTSHKKPKNPTKPQEAKGEVKNTLYKSYRNVIHAVRMVIGSFGRILARLFMKQDVFVSLPHRPHDITPLWLSDARAEDSGMVLCNASCLKEAIQGNHWTPEIAAQALCFSGNWYDLVVFAQELGDKRISLFSSIVASKIEASRFTLPPSLFPEAVIKELMIELWCTRELDASLFQCYQDLMKVAAMAQIEIFPDILATCLLNIRDVMQELPLIVPDEIYLPAPPVFCPQLIPNENLKEGNGDNGKNEVFSRKTLARWVRLFAVVISSSGIAQHLISDWCNLFNCDSDQKSDIYLQEISNLSDALMVRKGLVPQGPEWSSIFQSWQELLYHLWLLHCRDKLSLQLRKFSEFTPFHSKNKKKLGVLKEILTWTLEISKQTFSSVWKEKTISVALTAASNVSPCLDTVQTLSRILPDPAKLPSLLKDKAKRLFDAWKSTPFESELEADGYPDFFSLYEKFCAEEKKFLAENIRCQKVTDDDLRDEVCFAVPNFQETTKDMKREYQKLVFLFASMNFAKDAEAFPQYQVQIPSLTQFSSKITQLEFEGLRVQKHFFNLINCVKESSPVGSLTKFGNTRSLDEVDCALVEKRGLFRNLTYSHIWQNSTNTKLYINKSESLNASLYRISGKVSRRTQSLSPSVIKGHGQHVSSLKKPKPSKSSRKRGTRHSSEERLRKHQRSLGRASLRSSAPKHRSKSLQVKREEKKSKMLDLKNKSLTSESHGNLADHLKQLLSSIKRFSKINEAFEEDINFIYWMMSSERIFLCSPMRGNCRGQTVAIKINLQVEDVFYGLMWFHFPIILSTNFFHEGPSSPMGGATEGQIIPLTDQLLKEKFSKKKGRTYKKYASKKMRQVMSSTVKKDQPSLSEVNVHSRDKGEDKNTNEEDHANVCRSDEVSNTLKVKDEECHQELNVEKTDCTSAYTHIKENDDKMSSEIDLFNVKTESKSLSAEGEGHSEDMGMGSEGHPFDISPPVSSVPQKELLVPHTGSDRQILLDSSQVIFDKLKDMKVQLTVPEELRNLVQAQQDGIQAMISAAHKFKETFEKSQHVFQSCDAGNQTADLGKITLSDTRNVTKEINSEYKKDGSNIEEKTKNEIYHKKTKLASKEEPVIVSKDKNSWKPFKLKPDGLHVRPSKQVIEVHKTLKSQDHQNFEMPHPLTLKKKTLTPVEIPSEVQELKYFGATKLLHLPPENKSDSEKLTLSDLDDDEEYVSELHDHMAVDDTLDDITLPDSLHASDLEEVTVVDSASQHTIHEKLMRNKVRNTDSQSYVKRNKSKALSVKDQRVAEFSGIRSKHHQWDEQLQLKPVPFKIKPAVDGINKASGILSKNQTDTGHLTKKEGFQAPLKLLVLPKHDEKPRCHESLKEYKPLTLKKIPFGIVPQFLESQRKVTFPTRNIEETTKDTFVPTNTGSDILALGENKLRKLTLLKLPSSAANGKGKNKTETTFKFLHPAEVFSYYRRHMEKGEISKFRTLKVAEANNVQFNSIPTKSADKENHVNLGLRTGEFLHGVSPSVVEIPLPQGRQFGYEIPSPCQMPSAVEIPSYQKHSLVEMPSIQKKPSSADVSSPQKRTSFSELSSSQKQAVFVDVPSPQRKPSFTEESSLQRYSAAEILSSCQGTSAVDVHSEFEMPLIHEVPSGTEVNSNKESFGPEVASHGKSSATEISSLHDNISMNEPEGVCKYEATKQMAELYKLQRQHFQETKEMQTIDGSSSSNNSEGLANPIDEIASCEIYAKNSASVTDYGREILPGKLCDTLGGTDLVYSETKTVKDSWTETILAAEKTEVQTQTQPKTAVDASVTACVSPPPTSSSAVPHATFSFNHASLIVDPYSQASFPESVSGSVAHVVDIPQDVVKKRLKAIGDDLNRTIPSAPSNDPSVFSSVNQGYDTENSVLQSHLKEKLSEKKGTETLQDLVIEGKNRSLGSKSTSSSPSEIGTPKSVEISNKESTSSVEPLMGEHTPGRSDQMPFNQVSQEGDKNTCWTGDFTMENLTQAFIKGKLTFERFCELSNNAVETDDLLDKERGAKEGELHIKEVEELEKEAKAAVLGLQASKKLLSRLDVVIQESQRMEKEKFLERYVGSYSSRTAAYTRSRKPKASVKQEWQKVQSEFHSTQNADSLLQFIESVKPEDISDEMIDIIMHYTEIAEGLHEAKDHSAAKEKESKSVHTKRITSPRNQELRSDIHSPGHGTSVYSPDLLGENPSLVQQMQDLPYSPNLHIDLRSIRSESSSTFANVPNFLFSAQSNSSSIIEQEKQRKRTEIRKWMKEKRKERIKKSSDLQGKKSGLQLFGQMDSNLEHSGPKCGITGKQIRDSSREKEEKRRQLRRSLETKLEKDMNELLDDLSQQASSHRDLLHSSPSSLKKIPQKLSPKPVTFTSRAPRKQVYHDSYTYMAPKSFNETFTVSQENLASFNETYIIAKRNQPNLNETFTIAKKNQPAFNETFTIAKKNQPSFNETYKATTKYMPQGPHLGRDRFTTLRSEFLKPDDLGFGTFSQGNKSSNGKRDRLPLSQKNEVKAEYKNIVVELNKLTECIQSTDETRLSKPKRPSVQMQSVTRFNTQPKKESITKKVLVHQRASSVSLPLDRISEVDSDTFSSFSAGGEERSGNGSSSDISWNVPPEVKKVLYN
ncbi:uncharacterized protein LOC135221943 isoform X2 [Macrobrachium nipponense]|uniref:uncharacterized protein LOC135221943 isoform X2 n=1 Tax=Macrobrachium nipponense TaxID=159736 RepID=UPI0030C85362